MKTASGLDIRQKSPPEVSKHCKLQCVVTSEISAAREAPKIYAKQEGFHHLPDTLGMASLHEETPAGGQGGPQKVVKCCKLEGVRGSEVLKTQVWEPFITSPGLGGLKEVSAHDRF